MSAAEAHRPEWKRALQAADLVDALSSESDALTVLAPNNVAFETLLAALGTDASEELLADPEALASVLTLHVIEGKFTAAELEDGMELTTLAGITLTVGITADAVTFTPEDCGPSASVLVANFGSCASTLHVIDTVLTPGEGCAAGETMGSVSAAAAAPVAADSEVRPLPLTLPACTDHCTLGLIALLSRPTLG